MLLRLLHINICFLLVVHVSDQINNSFGTTCIDVIRYLDAVLIITFFFLCCVFFKENISRWPTPSYNATGIEGRRERI